MQKNIRKKIIINITIISCCALFYALGFNAIKYLLAVYILSFIFSIEISAVFIISVLLLIPLLIYYSWEALAESLAKAAFVFLVSGLLNKLTENYVFINSIRPKLSVKIQVALSFIYLLYAVIFGVFLQTTSS